MKRNPNYLIKTVKQINTLIDKNLGEEEVKLAIKQEPGPWSKEGYSVLISPVPVWTFIDGAVSIAYVLKHHKEILAELESIQPY